MNLQSSYELRMCLRELGDDVENITPLGAA